jgi:hypothetical protein
MVMLVNELKIEGTKTQPNITFKDGKLNIVGRSIPHDSCEWFAPLLNLMYVYSKNPELVTEINVHLDYLNSESNRTLMNLLVVAEKIYNTGRSVVIRWYYKSNDQVMLEQGNIFQSLIEIPFRFEPIN